MTAKTWKLGTHYFVRWADGLSEIVYVGRRGGETVVLRHGESVAMSLDAADRDLTQLGEVGRGWALIPPDVEPQQSLANTPVVPWHDSGTTGAPSDLHRGTPYRFDCTDGGGP